MGFRARHSEQTKDKSCGNKSCGNKKLLKEHLGSGIKVFFSPTRDLKVRWDVGIEEGADIDLSIFPTKVRIIFKKENNLFSTL